VEWESVVKQKGDSGEMKAVKTVGLKEVADALTRVLHLEPKIDVEQAEDALKNDIIEASSLIKSGKDRKELGEGVLLVVNELTGGGEKKEKKEKEEAEMKKEAAKSGKGVEKKGKDKSADKGKEAKGGKKEKAASTGKRAEYMAKKIKVLVKENPKREGSGAYKRFKLYKTGMTVGEAMKAGMKPGNIAHDEASKYIEVK
jgi:translation initiation factor 2B subunit (eIF-2B alpha/beta/delta family)